MIGWLLVTSENKNCLNPPTSESWGSPADSKMQLSAAAAAAAQRPPSRTGPADLRVLADLTLRVASTPMCVVKHMPYVGGIEIL